MKNYCLIVAIALTLTGCDFSLPGSRQALAESNVAEGDRLAKSKMAKYKAEVRPVKKYEPYHYQHEIKDPFRIRGFIMTDEVEPPTALLVNNEPVCKPPACVPPADHTRGFLEDYSLDDLAFVGTLERNGNVALIKTPDLGVVRIREGEYMGRKNGKILAIKETAIILQEKVYKSGLWEDKKTVLMINK